jgi:DNA-binding YbaB/EbfC family protein
MAGGVPDDGMEALLSRMGMLQQHLSEAEHRIGRQVVEGSAGGGAVVIRASGELSFDAVSIDPAVVEVDDISVLEDLVLAALRDAAAKLQALRREAMGAAVSGALAGLFGTFSEGAEAFEVGERRVDHDGLSEDGLPWALSPRDGHLDGPSAGLP